MKINGWRAQGCPIIMPNGGDKWRYIGLLSGRWRLEKHSETSSRRCGWGREYGDSKRAVLDAQWRCWTLASNQPGGQHSQYFIPPSSCTASPHLQQSHNPWIPSGSHLMPIHSIPPINNYPALTCFRALNQPTNQPNNQPTNQPTNQPNIQPNNQPNQPTTNSK